MGKFLFWLVILLAAFIVLRVLSFQKARARTHHNPSKPGRKQKAKPMVRCAHCGIYVPRDEALMSNHHTWCSLDHAKLGPRQH